MSRPALTPQAAADRVAREIREAAALRENLRRRKEQIRGRTAATPQQSVADYDAPAAKTQVNG